MNDERCGNGPDELGIGHAGEDSRKQRPGRQVAALALHSGEDVERQVDGNE
jgi:hypothetical protein